MPGVLNVCTANRCRSVIAERLLREWLPYEVPVTSAGLRARVGQPIWPDAGVELIRRRVSPYGFESAPVTPELVLGADLVLTATREQRDELSAHHPTAFRRIFTWRELAWLLYGVPPERIPGRQATERLRALADVAQARRARLVPLPPQELDVADPVEHGPLAVSEATAQIAAAVSVIAGAVTVSPAVLPVDLTGSASVPVPA